MASEANNKPTMFRAQDVRCETFLLSDPGESQRFMDLHAAGRLGTYFVSTGRIDAEVLPALG